MMFYQLKFQKMNINCFLLIIKLGISTDVPFDSLAHAYCFWSMVMIVTLLTVHHRG